MADISILLDFAIKLGTLQLMSSKAIHQWRNLDNLWILTEAIYLVLLKISLIDKNWSEIFTQNLLKVLKVKIKILKLYSLQMIQEIQAWQVKFFSLKGYKLHYSRKTVKAYLELIL